MGKPASLPGFQSPAVGFEQPFEMLQACHERVQRSLDLLRRLTAHIDAHGHDAASRSAAADVLRYFDLAAPLHHEDEELHVFPALAASPDAGVRQAIATLRDDHRRMAERWARARLVLLAWRDQPQPPAPERPEFAAPEPPAPPPAPAEKKTSKRRKAKAAEEPAPAPAAVPAVADAAPSGQPDLTLEQLRPAVDEVLAPADQAVSVP